MRKCREREKMEREWGNGGGEMEREIYSLSQNSLQESPPTCASLFLTRVELDFTWFMKTNFTEQYVYRAPAVYLQRQSRHKILRSPPSRMQIQFSPGVTFVMDRFVHYEHCRKNLGSFLRFATFVQNSRPPTLSIIGWSDPEAGGNIFWSCAREKLR